MLYDLNIDNYIPDLVANFTNNTMFKLVSRLSSQFLTHFWNAELVSVLSISLNVFLSIYLMWKKSSPKPENAEWQGIWRGLGKTLEAWRPAVSWDFTLEHLWYPEKLSECLSQGWCGLGRSKEAHLIWGLAHAYRALYNTLLERENFQTEIQTIGGSLQVNPDQSQEAPVLMSVSPVEGQKWKRVSSRLEGKEEEGTEEVREDAGEGHFRKPPSSRKATEKLKRQREESEKEEVTVTTTRRPVKMTEIQGSRKEFTRRLNETLVTWLLRCWDTGANSVFLDGNAARQLGGIAGDSATDRGISRCSDEAATLWERVLAAVKERYHFKENLKPEMKKWNAVEKVTQYLREKPWWRCCMTPCLFLTFHARTMIVREWGVHPIYGGNSQEQHQKSMLVH